MEESVVLVDLRDREIGTEEKLQAHRKGLLHRALSIFLFNQKGEWLLQQRALSKYHSPGLWSNTCCSHPRPGEAPLDAAHRRLHEEMGMSCDLQFRYTFLYRAELDHGLIEHELDHIFFGFTESDPSPNPDEVASWKWISGDLLQEDLTHYTAWFKLLCPSVRAAITSM